LFNLTEGLEKLNNLGENGQEIIRNVLSTDKLLQILNNRCDLFDLAKTVSSVVRLESTEVI
jgi:hypothetical protein